VLYALGGIGGGLTVFMDKGRLAYEYNMMMIERYIGGPKEKLGPGKHVIEIATAIGKPGGPGEVVITVDGKDEAHIALKRTVAGAFTASESFDVGVDLGSPVSFAYFDRKPFKFDGKIESVDVSLQ
jgi:arylsulfatase